MNIIERLISGYPQGDVSPQDFIDHLSIAPDFFSLEANPWYYIMGFVRLFFSVCGLVQYRKLAANQ